MNRNFVLTGVITAIANLILNGAAFFLFLKDFSEKHPPLSAELMKQFHRPPERLIPWAMIMTTLCFGFLITTIISWSGARSFMTGIRMGLLVSSLFWSSVNFGIYASSNLWSLAGMFADLGCSITAMTLSCGVAALMLGRSGK